MLAELGPVFASSGRRDAEELTRLVSARWGSRSWPRGLLAAARRAARGAGPPRARAGARARGGTRPPVRPAAALSAARRPSGPSSRCASPRRRRARRRSQSSTSTGTSRARSCAARPPPAREPRRAARRHLPEDDPSCRALLAELFVQAGREAPAPASSRSRACSSSSRASSARSTARAPAAARSRAGAAPRTGQARDRRRPTSGRWRETGGVGHAGLRRAARSNMCSFFPSQSRTIRYMDRVSLQQMLGQGLSLAEIGARSGGTRRRSPIGSRSRPAGGEPRQARGAWWSARDELEPLVERACRSRRSPRRSSAARRRCATG